MSLSTKELKSEVADDSIDPEDGFDGPLPNASDAPDLDAEEDEVSHSDSDAFEKAAKAKGVKSLKSMFRGRHPKEQLVLLPAEVEAATNAVKLRARDLDVRLKRLFAWVVVIAVSLQLLVADFFLLYYVVWADQKLSDPVLVAWLSASVVEVIGIVAVVARNLFPDRRKIKNTGDGKQTN